MIQYILTAIIALITGGLVVGFILNKKLELEKNKNFELNNKNVSLKAELKVYEENKSNEETLKNLIKEEFSNTAAKILIEKQQYLNEQNKTSLETFLNPLKEKIKEFQQKVEKADETGKINAATLREKIEELVKQNQITCSQTEKLSNAISQNSKFRGSMGEMILEKLLKSSGLIDKKDNPTGNYETQKGFRQENGDTGTKIVDAIVYLSEGKKSVVIDSKASLAEFISFTEATDEQEKEKHLNAFLKDVKDRINELTGKYDNLEGLVTPDFTIMFIPFEYPLTYIYSNSNLIEYALKNNIIISGPSTLIATLRTINYSWSQKSQYENMQNITCLAKNIYEKTFTLIQKFEGVQTSFETVRKKFDEVFTTIKGQRGLISQVEKLKDYGTISPKQIDEKYLEDIPKLTLTGQNQE